MVRYVMLCYVAICYVMLCSVMLRYVMLCYVMLCYVEMMERVLASMLLGGRAGFQNLYDEPVLYENPILELSWLSNASDYFIALFLYTID